MTTTMEKPTEAAPRTSAFSIRGPYLSAGRLNIDLAQTDLLWLSLKVNAEGGENAVHAHTDEDHAFIVLEGEVTFFDENGEETVIGQHEGIMIPRGRTTATSTPAGATCSSCASAPSATRAAASRRASSPTGAPYPATPPRTSTSTPRRSRASSSASASRGGGGAPPMPVIPAHPTTVIPA